jgi:hypothetical protein
MQKIPTMFVRDESKKGHPVMLAIKTECQWVLDGEGVATAKLDGTNVKIENGQLLKRQKPLNGDYDEACYVPCDRANPADKWAFEAFDALATKGDGIYELVGPKVQGNPHGYRGHVLELVVPPGEMVMALELGPADLSFDGLREWLSRSPFEGIVFHHPDGRMAKIKRRDFGLPWPIRVEARG